jgi:hypothetical protein
MPTAIKSFELLSSYVYLHYAGKRDPELESRIGQLLSTELTSACDALVANCKLAVSDLEYVRESMEDEEETDLAAATVTQIVRLNLAAKYLRENSPSPLTPDQTTALDSAVNELNKAVEEYVEFLWQATSSTFVNDMCTLLRQINEPNPVWLDRLFPIQLAKLPIRVLRSNDAIALNVAAKHAQAGTEQKKSGDTTIEADDLVWQFVDNSLHLSFHSNSPISTHLRLQVRIAFQKGDEFKSVPLDPVEFYRVGLNEWRSKVDLKEIAPNFVGWEVVKVGAAHE